MPSFLNSCLLVQYCSCMRWNYVTSATFLIPQAPSFRSWRIWHLRTIKLSLLSLRLLNWDKRWYYPWRCFLAIVPSDIDDQLLGRSKSSTVRRIFPFLYWWRWRPLRSWFKMWENPSLTFRNNKELWNVHEEWSPSNSNPNILHRCQVVLPLYYCISPL